MGPASGHEPQHRVSPVSWELVEPAEGQFDFSTIDRLVDDARKHDLRLVLLWFGTWKNSNSTSVPTWVNQDTERFARALDAEGNVQEIMSAHSQEARAADAKAFAALMAHLKAIDGERHTVIMVQVESEVGFLSLPKEGEPVAGPAEDEILQARAYASFVNAVARAGKEQYALPMFANGAQPRPGAKPGEYPSGGPLAHLAQQWWQGAPHLDFIAPDIFFDNFSEITDAYVRSGQPLFIPAANWADNPRVGANALRAIGRNAALGFSPFSIDTASDAGAKRIASLYGMLRDLSPIVLQAQADGRIAGFSNPVSFEGVVDLSPMVESFGGFTSSATTIDPWTPRDKQDPATHGVLLIWLGGEEFLVAGQGVTLTVEDSDGQGQVGLETVEEGRIEYGKFFATRLLNDDQAQQRRYVRLPPGDYTIQKIRLNRN